MLDSSVSGQLKKINISQRTRRNTEIAEKAIEPARRWREFSLS
jgi:hypothetical protein